MSVLIKAKETTYETNLSLSQMVQGNYIWHKFHGEDAALETKRTEKLEEESQLKIQGKHFSDISQAREKTMVRKRRHWRPWGKGEKSEICLFNLSLDSGR